MNKATVISLEMILAAVFLGISGDYLFRTEPGLNVGIWTLLFVASIAAISIRRLPKMWTQSMMALCAALLFFAFMFAIRASIQLTLLNFVAIFVILTALVVPWLAKDTRCANIFNYFVASCLAGASAAFGPFLVVGDDIKWKTVPKPGVTNQLISGLRGLAIAVPIVVVIGALLMSADAAFESFIVTRFEIDPESILLHTIITGAVFWVTLGYMRAVFFGYSYTVGRPNPASSQAVSAGATATSATATLNSVSKPAPNPLEGLISYFRIGVIETSLILGLMNVLFIAFVIFQIPYLFGGMDLVQQTPDFKLADYARRGVAELINVSLLVLPILLVLHWLIKKDKPIHEKVFRALAAIQIALLFVIMASAVQRLFLLIGSSGYGLTEYRFYAVFFLIWLTLVFVWFAMTVLRGNRRHFAFGTLWVSLFIIGILNVVNPDAFIVRTNVDLMTQGRSFDAIYNGGLSADAAPALIESLPSLSVADRSRVTSYLNNRYCTEDDKHDFRSWNWSHESAKKLAASEVGQCVAKNKVADKSP